MITGGFRSPDAHSIGNSPRSNRDVGASFRPGLDRRRRRRPSAGVPRQRRAPCGSRCCDGGSVGGPRPPALPGPRERRSGVRGPENDPCAPQQRGYHAARRDVSQDL